MSNARWAAHATLHVTLRFFGATTDEQLEALRPLVTELGRAASASCGPVRAPAVTGFPTPRRAHVLVTDIVDGGALAALAARAEEVAVTLGFAPESRAYRPHLTLARMRRPVDVVDLAGEAASLPAGRVIAVTLYGSTTAATGPVYTPLERVTLGEGAPAA